MQKIVSREIKAFLNGEGADLVGIARADCFETKHSRRGPKFIMPQARSIVVFAQRMLVGCIESPSDMVVTIQGISLYDELQTLAYKTGRLLESRGYRAAIVPGYSPVDMSLETKGLAGEVSLRHAAVGAGLGQLGRNNLLVTSEFGPRVRLCAVVTTAELDPDRPSQKHFCDDCEACVSACPVDALSEPGQTRTGKCLRQVLPYGLTGLIDYLTSVLEKSKEEVAATFKTSGFWNTYQSLQLGIQYGCHACINACPVGDMNPA
jgi:epoxyqueuosine reductase QueG